MVFPPIWGKKWRRSELNMRMQVILDSSFARPGSAPIWGGKKVEFRDWTRNSHDPNTDLELNNRAFAWPFAHIPFIQLEEQRNAKNVPTILFQVGPKKVPLTNDVKISLRARFCSPAIIGRGRAKYRYLSVAR